MSGPTEQPPEASPPMLPKVVRVARDEAYPGHDGLFAGVETFLFVPGRRGGMVVRSLPLGAVTVASVESVGHDIALLEPDRLSFLAPLQGGLSVEADGTLLAAQPGAGLFLRAGWRRTAVRAPGSGRFRALVALAPVRPGIRRGSPALPGQALPAMAEAGAGRALHHYLHYLVQECARPDSPFQRTSVRRSAEALILDLMSELDGFDAAPAAAEIALAEKRVAQAEAFMRAHAEEALTIERIAEAAGVGPRALQLAFRRLRGVAPRAVLTGIRLERARARLVAPDPAASVTDIALLCGFAHFGRFAAAYRARFGESPSETLRRARS